ncbi:MAG TPA: glycosyltransferase [Tepidisphaeraceae bacterium]|jgi:glycosyltransferase involved in cell wall biosynthesis
MNNARIVHIINSFEFGGAESMLCNLLLRSDRKRFDISVVSLIDDLTVAGPIVDAGIPIKVIGMKPGIPSPRGVARLAKHLRALRPNVIQTWMDHSNLIGGVAAKFVPSAAVVWGIHHSNHVPGLTKRSTLMTVGACAKLSRRLPHRIVFCSENARQTYIGRGFDAERSMVIPNGFDLSAFRPDAAARAAVRQELALPSEAVVIGLVARYDPMKDHANFLNAAALLTQRFPDVHFLLCGRDVHVENEALMGHIHALGIADHCHLLGPRRDIPRIHASLDILISSSLSEAFPLTIGEAMACGVPCVATDVGDSALIVGDTGKIAPSQDPESLAAACAELLSMRPADRHRLGSAARQRVQELFDLSSVTERYQDLYQSLAAEGEVDHVSLASRPGAVSMG